MRPHSIPMVLLLIGLVGCAAAPAVEENAPPSPSRTPTELAAAYLDAMELNDLDAAQALFADQSSVFESGGDEGSWQHYREHHLGPEVDAIESFVVTRGDTESLASHDRSLAFVAWPIEYRIQLRDGRTIESRGTVTFVMELAGAEYRIRHLHWSSKKRPKES